MTVGCFILAVDMGVAMGMCVRMGVDQISVGVFVGMAVAMLMGMLQRNGIFHHQHRCPKHNDKTNIELDKRSFPQKQHTKQHPEKRRNGIIGTCFRCAQFFLRFDVEIDAEAVRNKPKEHYQQDPHDTGDLFASDQRHDQTAQTGKDAFDRSDLHGRFVAQHPGAVILQSPAAGRSQHQQRAGIKSKTARSLDAQSNTCHRHQYNSNHQPLGQLLPECKKRDQ